MHHNIERMILFMVHFGRLCEHLGRIHFQVVSIFRKFFTPWPREHNLTQYERETTTAKAYLSHGDGIPRANVRPEYCTYTVYRSMRLGRADWTGQLNNTDAVNSHTSCPVASTGMHVFRGAIQIHNNFVSCCTTIMHYCSARYCSTGVL